MRQILFISSFVALVTVFDARAAELSSAEIKAARKLYVTKCTKCHELYDATQYQALEWDKWMNSMKKKSKLKEEQFELLIRYTAKLRSDHTSDTQPEAKK